MEIVDKSRRERIWNMRISWTAVTEWAVIKRVGNLPLYETVGANHSMETGNVQEDLKNLAEIMRVTEEYIARTAR